MAKPNPVRENLIRLRQQKGWTQEYLAKEASLSSMAVIQIETGRRERPRMDTLQKLAKALGVSIDELSGQSAPPTKDPVSRADLKLLIEGEAETLPIRLLEPLLQAFLGSDVEGDRKSTRLNSSH